MAASLALHAFARAAGRVAPMSFVEAVRLYQHEVFGVALRITGEREAANDVMNTTFMKAYRAFDRYDQSRPIRYWLLRIATNEAISYVRRTGRDLRRRADLEAAADVPDRATPPDVASVEREERERIRSAVAGLPELYRVVIVLRYFNDLAVDEIAAVTGRPVSTVGVQLLRGRALLRRSLEEAVR
jgi:RNA polymerase sigma-70 factor (ECF subfamily)